MVLADDGDTPLTLPHADLQMTPLSISTVPRSALAIALAMLPTPLAAQAFDYVRSDTQLAPLGLVFDGGFADFDRDGVPDAFAGAFAIFSSTYQVFLGQGDGTFVPGPSASAPQFTTAMQVADVDGDGLPDALLIHNTGTEVAINNGSGFTNRGRIATTAMLNVYDVNGDGLPDIVGSSGNTSPYSLRIHIGLGNGLFAAAVSVPVPEFVEVAETADVDRDGDVDLVVVLRPNFNNSMVSVLRTTPGSTPTLDPPVVTNVAGQTTAELGDFDEDGFVDIAVQANFVADWVRGTAQGFGAVQPVNVLGRRHLIHAADLEGDGHVDLIGAGLNGEVLVFAGDGNGQFAAATVFNPGQSQGFDPDASIVDVNGDGWLDLATIGRDVIVLRRNPPPTPGATPFGTGSAPCLGNIGISASESPRVGSASMRIRFTNAPPHSLGVLVIGGPADPVGVDPGFGVLMHTGQSFCSTEQWMTCDGGGLASAPLPVPPVQALVGLEQHAQGVFLYPLGQGDGCSSPPLGLLSSRALTLRVEP